MKSNHKQNDLVSPYQFNDVSLLKINTTHDIDPRTKTFDSYFIKLADTNKSFKSTKRVWKKLEDISKYTIWNCKSTSNFNYSYRCNFSGRVKTTSGTSIMDLKHHLMMRDLKMLLLINNELDTPRIIASEVNEFNLLGNKDHLVLNLH